MSEIEEDFFKSAQQLLNYMGTHDAFPLAPTVRVIGSWPPMPQLEGEAEVMVEAALQRIELIKDHQELAVFLSRFERAVTEENYLLSFALLKILCTTLAVSTAYDPVPRGSGVIQEKTVRLLTKREELSHWFQKILSVISKRFRA